DTFDHPHEARRVADIATSAVRPANLHILAWNPDRGRLARVSVPFWLLRMGHGKFNLVPSEGSGFTLERLNLDVPDLERIGPALVLDYGAQSGERVLIWTE